MPEIPEIEGLVAFLSRKVIGSVFASVQIGAISVVKTANPPLSALVDDEIDSVGRSGKFLWLHTKAGLFLATHLSRAGWLRWYDSPPATRIKMGNGPLAARFTLIDSAGTITGGFDLTEAGTQKRLALYLVADLNQISGVARLGPDPLAPAFTDDHLRQILADQGGRHLKTLLRDQSVLAGIGNAYSDEILHLAKLNPTAASNSLSTDQQTALFAALHHILDPAIADAATRKPAELKDGKRQSMRVHGRSGLACEVCQDTIASVSSADSDYQYCPTCQTGGRLLADRRMSRLLK